MIEKLKPFVGKIITVGRYCGHESPDGVRKQVMYVDNDGHLNYILGLCEDDSPCFMCGMGLSDEDDIENNYNIKYLREVNEYELKVYTKEVDNYFSEIFKEKNRPPIARFPLPIINKIKMPEKWKKELINEQK